jgi:hypothetical protein
LTKQDRKRKVRERAGNLVIFMIKQILRYWKSWARALACGEKAEEAKAAVDGLRHGGMRPLDLVDN